MKMYLFSLASVDDAELALSQRQKKGQIFTVNMSYLTYYWNLKHKNSRFEVSPYTITDYTKRRQKKEQTKQIRAENRQKKVETGRKQCDQWFRFCEKSLEHLKEYFESAQNHHPFPAVEGMCRYLLVNSDQ